MVDDPRDALELFGSAPVDLLVLGPHLVRRADAVRGWSPMISHAVRYSIVIPSIGRPSLMTLLDAAGRLRWARGPDAVVVRRRPPFGTRTGAPG